MDTELISWMHQYNLMRTFPHIWKIKKIRKWKELNTICSGCETSSSIYTWHSSCLYAIVKTTPLGFSWPKRREKLISLVWLSNCNMETNFESYEAILSIFRKLLWSHCLSDIYLFLGNNVMGKPFWGRAKGPYWIPFFAPTTDHLHQKKIEAAHASLETP